MQIDYCLYQNNLPALVSKLQLLDPTIRWQVIVREWKSKRSNDQNSRYWKLLTEFGKYLGYTQDEMHDICRFKFLRNAIDIEGERLPLLKTTTKLTVAEFTDYMESIERWGHEMGFYFEG